MWASPERPSRHRRTNQEGQKAAWALVDRAAAGLLALCFAPDSAWAQANYDAGLIGGRSSLMGGTGVAAGTDGAAPLQNPATTVAVPGTSLALSALFVQVTYRRVLGAQEGRMGADQELTQTDLDVLPNSSCLFLDINGTGGARKGNHKISLCMAAPEQVFFNLRAQTQNEPQGVLGSRAIDYRFEKKVYAVSWAHALSERWSVGVTPMLQDVDFYDLEIVSRIDGSIADPSLGMAGAGVSVVDKRAGGLAGSVLAGVQFAPSGQVRIGAAIESPGLHLAGGYAATRSSETVQGTREEYVEELGTARFQYPLRAAVGIAAQLPWFFFEFDTHFHAGRRDFVVFDGRRNRGSIEGGVAEDISATDVVTRESVRPVLNVGLGVDVPINAHWSAVFGILSDLTGQAEQRTVRNADERIFRSRMDAIHGSVGMAWTPRAGSLLFGARGFFADGTLLLTDAEQARAPSVLVDQNNWGIGIGIAGQFSFEMLTRVDPTGIVKKTIEGETDGSESGAEDEERAR